MFDHSARGPSDCDGASAAALRPGTDVKNVKRRPRTERKTIVAARSFPDIIEYASRMWPTSA